jgi:hypothetical protein
MTTINTTNSSVLDAERERDEALAQVARRDREHGALLETAQKALAHVEAERDKVASRARRACQILIEEIGADRPSDVDTVAERAVVRIRELRDQVSDLQAAAEESEHQMHLRIRSGYDKTIADSWRAALAKVEREREALRRVYVATSGWLTHLGAKGHRYNDGVPGELMDAVDAYEDFTKTPTKEQP